MGDLSGVNCRLYLEIHAGMRLPARVFFRPSLRSQHQLFTVVDALQIPGGVRFV